MGWRYRKSVSFGPLRLNVGRRGIGTSVGVRGIRLSDGADGRRRLTLTVPGTGWSYIKNLPKPGGRTTPITGTSLPHPGQHPAPVTSTPPNIPPPKPTGTPTNAVP